MKKIVTLKKFLNLALGVGALMAALSAAPQAHAVTWGPSTGPGGIAYWTDVAVDGHIWTASRLARFLTYAASNNPHSGGYFVECVNQPFYGFPSGGRQTWYGSALRNEYWCPNYANLTSSFGWVDDNYYQ
jgi:hypothetical protein